MLSVKLFEGVPHFLSIYVTEIPPFSLKYRAHAHLGVPAYGGTMAAMVAGGISADVVLEMGERTDGHAGGGGSAAVIVAGVVSKAGGGRKNDRFAALHPAFNDDIGLARNLRAALGPQRMPVASAGGPLIGFAGGGQNADSEPLRKSETDVGR